MVDTTNTDPDYWEKILKAEGMPETPVKKLRRATVADEHGRRPWLGTYEFTSERLGQGSSSTYRDATEGNHRTVTQASSPASFIAALMETSPGAPQGRSAEERERTSLLLRDAINECLDGLSMGDLQLANMRFLDGMTFREIGEEMDIAKETARSACIRMLRNLTELLEAHPTIQEWEKGMLD